MNIEYIVETLTRQTILEKLHVGASALSNAEQRGLFPASWFSDIKELCEPHDIDAPETLFAFKKTKREAEAA